MARIETVLGPIAPEALGVTDMHDHLITIGGGEVRADPDLCLPSVEKAVQELTRFEAAGGQALVDMNPIGCGRAIPELLSIARQTSVHIVAATGFQRQIYYEETHWFYRYDVDEIAALMASEIREGIDEHSFEGPHVRRSTARAGIIKGASDYNVIRPLEEKLFRAIARAQRLTGAAISTHCERGTMALEQIELLAAEGVNPSRVVVGHVDRNPDLWYHKKIASTGAALSYDGPSRIKYYPDSVIVDLILRMVDAGYADHLVLGGDNGRASYWKAYGGGPGLAYVLERFVPRLREEGLEESAIRKILVDNPRRILSF
jgi:phosphotriesterase-related protein